MPAVELLASREVAGLTLFDARTASASTSHCHGSPFISLNVCGSFRESFGARVEEQKPGAATFHPAGEEHSVRPESPLKCFNIDLNDEWVERVHSCARRTTTYGPLAWLVARVHAEFIHWDSLSALRVQELVLRMIAALPDAERFHVARRPPWLLKVEEMLRADFNKPLLVRDLAAVAGVHPVHLARVFRRFNGCSIAQFVRRLRLQYTCEVLARDCSQPPLACLALDAGFADQTHFSHAFRALTGMTPSMYRAHFARARARMLD